MPQNVASPQHKKVKKMWALTDKCAVLAISVQFLEIFVKSVDIKENSKIILNLFWCNLS